ncbi:MULTISPECIES: N-acetylmuramic acid 6-phosphate etherase [unclassified Oceanispirochaeta]|uniref:N-acetylmuramic acid 6-phosphate etherase n=1 Tax=unclassified Oceanispirochaeta TaxID=2635722 RepID=UPI000E0960BE|nr:MULTISPECIES: N-acetylmuramic acid 6-phosphate etherase [unclassified Oceanispirochaeta]MBF9017707.1 N-acetylmuramic acid 6-phosphate etherase [Oceanispirochaeta sp. M2]NPD72110.1 N-acetylmuramic acid 6-phosphate etherase [Oceanispirochaeta sp. M1]RDG32552.1 N-acetylmuramic acid 6-phosphate etherase [Oceanispirochaeta sp. M1]
MDNLSELVTEQANPASLGIDTKNSHEILEIIINEDKKVPLAVEKALPQISPLVDRVVEQFKKGGRLFYIGAGTSGRLGVLDASECPPTYGSDPEMVQGIIAGGQEALTRSVEWAEDDENQGKQTLLDRGFTADDILIGITASGQAPFVIGAMKYAQSIGAAVGALGCNKGSLIFNHADYPVFMDVGPEIVTGSTRMKSGTAQKLVLNMITTSSMILMGKVYNNLMVDLKPVNQKLILRAKRLILMATGCSPEEAGKVFETSGHHVKTAIVMQLLGTDKDNAVALLEENEGKIGLVLKK